MPKSFYRLFAFSLVLLALPNIARAEEPLVLQFGIYTAVKPTELIRKFKPLTKAIEEKMSVSLGRKVDVRFKVAADYGHGIEDIATGKADFSRFGPVSYIEATKKNPKLSLLAVEGNGGSKVTYGIIAVRNDSDIKAVADLKGKSFAFGNELSTIGRYLAQQHLLQHGLRAKDLSKFEYLDRHDAVGAAIGTGRFDAGALKEATFSEMKSSGTRLRELARFPNAPQAWIGREGMPKDVHDALSAALLALTEAEALALLNADQLLPASDEDFALIRDAMETNEQFFQ